MTREDQRMTDARIKRGIAREQRKTAKAHRMRTPGGTLNVGSAGSSARQNTVCGTSDASDQPAGIGGQGFDSPPALPAPKKAKPSCVFEHGDGRTRTPTVAHRPEPRR